ncbi:hypothetical protein HBI25_141580 [Parastagonospora nodorum]|nr:hypothetical protein HBH50_108860 [Parastagonospora nodorum]KAH4088173.1 hypothetical protein HBH48_125830 [Parastagonospora nodorum]KAH4271711.1 hypothetical protein HBI03_036200 [Parastagonospora nodorum]KAH4282396.1 hypothetical protein HBI04_031060 [Parastagonospora nodorum]KAH4607580.1 hypothetical protein HBH82_091300 [Parastagonospora nodorum]
MNENSVAACGNSTRSSSSFDKTEIELLLKHCELEKAQKPKIWHTLWQRMRQRGAYSFIAFIFGLTMVVSIVTNVYLFAKLSSTCIRQQIGADPSGWIQDFHVEQRTFSNTLRYSYDPYNGTEEDMLSAKLAWKELLIEAEIIQWFLQHQHFRALTGQKLVIPNEHFAHCIELLAQSIKCFGDLSTGQQDVHICKKASDLDVLFHDKKIVDENYAWNHSFPPGIEILRREQAAGYDVPVL